MLPVLDPRFTACSIWKAETLYYPTSRSTKQSILNSGFCQRQFSRACINCLWFLSLGCLDRKVLSSGGGGTGHGAPGKPYFELLPLGQQVSCSTPLSLNLQLSLLCRWVPCSVCPAYVQPFCEGLWEEGLRMANGQYPASRH